MKRLIPLFTSTVALFAATAVPLHAAEQCANFDVFETTIPLIESALLSRVASAEGIAQLYLARIAAYDKAGPGINAYLYLNPNALAQARSLDATPRDARGPLFGVPVILKDNIDTADMPTTAGSVALAGNLPPQDAFITRKLRQAGALIMGKGTLTEFANFLALGMPTGYSSLGGFGFNPYDPRPDPRPGFNDGRPVLQTGGSSSGPGIGVNADLAAVGVGTETSGSLLSPASANGIVAIKPTVGLVSRHGIIPITADQDTAGPMARTVTDAAIVLGVLQGYDPQDPATTPCLTAGNCFNDYTPFLNPTALQGARLAVYTPANPLPANRQALLDNAVAVLRGQGATVRILAVSDIPAQLGTCVSYPIPAIPAPPTLQCSSVLLYGFKRDLNAYLAEHPAAPNHSLMEIVAFNAAYMPALKYGQAIAEAAAQVDISPTSADTARFKQDRALDLVRSRDALNALFNATGDDHVDAIISVGNFFAAAPAKAGFPSVTVPGGFITAGPGDPPIANPFPQTITFTGPAFSEPRLIGLGYAFEQATHYRIPPGSTPALPAPAATELKVCHKGRTTLTFPCITNAYRAHLAHGDAVGACPAQ
ncbi:MAG: amidase family protein [Verrucomicrobiota bacterium]|nr:amidase family protein [Verrucomicrobiota bacterium]